MTGIAVCTSCPPSSARAWVFPGIRGRYRTAGPRYRARLQPGLRQATRHRPDPGGTAAPVAIRRTVQPGAGSAGEVKASGTYPLEPGMRISDLIPGGRQPLRGSLYAEGGADALRHHGQRSTFRERYRHRSRRRVARRGIGRPGAGSARPRQYQQDLRVGLRMDGGRSRARSSFRATTGCVAAKRCARYWSVRAGSPTRRFPRGLFSCASR